MNASVGPTFSWVPLGWNEPYVPWYTYSPNIGGRSIALTCATWRRNRGARVLTSTQQFRAL